MCRGLGDLLDHLADDGVDRDGGRGCETATQDVHEEPRDAAESKQDEAEQEVGPEHERLFLRCGVQDSSCFPFFSTITHFIYKVKKHPYL